MKGATILYGLLASTASAHMQMSKPYPIRSPLNKDSDGQKDYSYTNPLSTSGSDYPCKGYANDPFESQATYQPGGSYEMELEGSATHDGGSCQLALTYDKGKTFKVIESILGDCPIAKKYDFKIPSDAPSGEALLAWTWFNKVGNREMYMNCAMVTIGGGSNGKETADSPKAGGKKVDGQQAGGAKETEDKQAAHPPMEMEKMEHPHENQRRESMEAETGFSSLPEIFVANVDQAGKCQTIEGEAVDFPEPGDNVVGQTDGKGKGYKCDGDAPFLGSGNGTKKASAKPADKAGKKSGKKAGKETSKNTGDKVANASDKRVLASSTTTPSMSASKIASAFGSASANPRIFSTEASTNNNYGNYVGRFTCVSGEILCSPDGYTWAMCSNGRPIFMGSVAAGMSCRLGQMVLTGY
ncbi:uncharacterized protein N7459_004660 [Penicillium hispanicum]|uniref:uncharacterized protein n=1 Tax=Penicillium hispanicum TaxID=1080232 RepID=UPI002541BC95|nr:uncharacterized protein N7459_004660 [Penicillium hispanicum]KAJ5584860.1 hypothetical protein N7459_004660 [Penicillium hispanicum]